MKLTDLDPRLVRRVVTPDHPTAIVNAAGEHVTVLRDRVEMHPVATLADAQGLMFLCPACFAKNGGAVGTHACLTWFDGRGVAVEADPKPRWQLSGSCLDDLTLSPSVLLVGGCGWHGWITNGEVTTC